MTKLTGPQLLQHRENCRAAGMSAADTVRSAGYIGQRKDGSERIYFTEFYEEVLIAQGKMVRVNIDVAELTSIGVEHIWSDSFTTSRRSVRSVSRKVRQLTKLTGVKCKRTFHNGVVVLYPYRSDKIVSYNIPAWV